MMINPIKIRVKPTGDAFLIHDTKGDIRKLAKAVNIIIDKQTEMINMLNEVVKITNENQK